MSDIRQFAGSKKKARILERDQRRQKALDKRLQKIYAYCRLIKNEDELDAWLKGIEDDSVRAETKKLCESFCLFKFRKIVLADGPLEKQTSIVHHHLQPGGVH